MRQLFWFWRWGVFSLLLVVLFSCSTNDYRKRRQWFENNGKIKVLSSIAMIDDLVALVGGEHVDSTVLIRGELDPHSYQLVKGDDEKLAFAQIIFTNGLGLEHGPSLRRYLEQSEKAIPLGNLIVEENPDFLLHENGQVDPHIWMDISLWAKAVPFLVKKLSELAPKHAETFALNGEKLVKKMLKKHLDIQKMMRAIPETKRYLVTSHDAFNYFTRSYLAQEGETTKKQWKKRFAAPEGLAPESQLSSIDIQNIIEHLKKYNIHVIFPECNVSKDSINKILQAGREMGLEIVIANECLYADSMAEGQSYLEMVRHNATLMKKYWMGRGNGS